MTTQHVLNFVKTTLRAPVAVSDTQLQLASGTGSAFNPILAGEWCYITVNDSTTVEVMKYISTGNVVNDTITVVRAQDGTGAKAFPVGACVAIGWNVAQVTALVDQEILNVFDTVSLPANTIRVSSTPVGAPGANIIYAVNPATGQLWYYNSAGPGWVYINSNSVQVRTTAPSSAPPANIIWAINTVTSSLYYWTGISWLLISGSGGAGYLEAFGRQYLSNSGGVALAAGTSNVFSTMITDATLSPVTTSINYKSNPAITNVIQIESNNVVKLLAPCVAEFTATVFGNMPDFTHDFRASLTIFHPAGLPYWGNSIALPASSGWTGVEINVNTGPIQVTANEEFDLNLVVQDGGASYVGFNVEYIVFTATILALL